MERILEPVILDLLTQIESANTAEEMHALIGRAVHGFGFDGYSYHLYKPENGSMDYVGEWPHEWLKRYEENHYSDIDPVVEHLLQSMTPFTWSEAVADRPINSPERIVMNEARDFGIKEGGEIPVHEYGFGGATFSVFSSSFEGFGSAWTEHRHDLHMFCLYFHEKYRRFASAPVTVPAPHLTQRERECLVLTSRGKTAWEIGGILSISERTAKQHLGSAAAKLGSHSKHHAVVKAILTRIILP